jgi:hypothetical protein
VAEPVVPHRELLGGPPAPLELAAGCRLFGDAEVILRQRWGSKAAQGFGIRHKK